VKVTACLALAVALSRAQSTSSTPDPAAQPQSQDSSQQSPAPQSPAPQQPSDKDKDSDKTNSDKSGQTSGKVEGTSNDRLFYTLPNFLTLENTAKLPPLSSKDKFKVVALGTFDYIQYPWWGILAALSQGFNGDPGLGQGWKSYAQRYGITAGDSMVENFMVGAVYPSILRQDPRFYQSGKGGFGRRVGYSISRIFITRTDSGKSQFNYSEIFGAGTAAAISTYSYHPRSAIVNGHFEASERTFDNMGTTWATQIGLDTMTLVIKEFWPDVHRKLSKKKSVEVGEQSATPVK